MAKKAREILVINGPNIHMTGMRETGVYGGDTLDKINLHISDSAKKRGISLNFFQSNIEGEIINAIWGAKEKDGIIINPGAFSHYSYAIRDAIAGANVPAVEVHMSNIYAREDFRHKSVVSPVCMGQITGLGRHSYTAALNVLADIWECEK